MKRTATIILAITCLLCITDCHRATPEEELMSDLQKILQDAYGKDCRVHKIHTVRDHRHGK
ncbi:MAG: hypothetical protein JXA20_10805 [Spirochaetes bacterium]|nr:hypothetical protein [Spirochaetota bacterium]